MCLATGGAGWLECDCQGEGGVELGCRRHYSLYRSVVAHKARYLLTFAVDVGLVGFSVGSPIS